jgi:hypothetical protein
MPRGSDLGAGGPRCLTALGHRQPRRRRQRRYPRQHECGCRPGLHQGRACRPKRTSRFSLRRARASRPRGGRRRSCSWRSSRPAAPGPAITSSPSGRAGMVGVSDGCDRDGGVAGQGAWAPAHLGSGASTPTVVSHTAAAQNPAARLRAAIGTVALSGRQNACRWGLAGSWSGWTVAEWVDEELRPSAAACEDGEDFRLKDVA